MDNQLFDDLLNKYLAEQISAEETRHFFKLLEDPVYRERLEHQVYTELVAGTYEEAGESTVQERIKKKLRQLIQQPVVIQMPVKKQMPDWKKWAAAAAVLIMIGLGVYYLLPRNTTGTIPGKQTAAYDIQPGGNKAILTLSAGERIVLDSAANGTLAQQGSTRVTKLADGQLAYVVEGKATQEMVYNTMTTPRGGQYRLSLPDGTAVWLNAESSITFPASFEPGERRVSITGEVYFEVAHVVSANGTKLPFIVQKGNMAVQVLGTHFNINSYENEETIKTTLFEGSVNVSVGDKTALIKPGQQTQVSGNDQLTVKEDVDLQAVMAWKNGFFSFTDANLQMILRQAARWYDVDIVIEPGVAPVQFSGKIGRGLTLKEFISILDETRIHYRLESKKLTIIP